jgi:hypothetical protein
MQRLAVILACLLAPVAMAQQVEHVPFGHPVQDLLDRLGVRGVLPLASIVVRPVERREAARLLDSAFAHRDRLTPVERATVEKFRIEFAPDPGTRPAHDAVLLAPHESFAGVLRDVVSDKEKHLYAAVDSGASLIVDLLGSLEYRSQHGASSGSTDATLGTIGGRFRGTIGGKLGYMLQATNGVMYGNRALALSDPHLAANVKFKNLESANFDFTEAYLRYSFGWAGVQFGREYTSIGTGYSDRLILSGNAPAMDFFSIDARYRTFRFFFLHGAILAADAEGRGLLEQAPAASSKYLALHRFQFSLFDRVNVGASEMVVYQRLTPEYAYLIPVNFFKSAEHQLRDRDNAILAFDLEYFLVDNWKIYGTWLIDDITISRMGTGWWGNEFGWQAGVYASNIFGCADVDGIVEYARVEPYVYSNRVAGNDYTHNNIALGPDLPPNADELTVEGRWMTSPWLRIRLQGAYRRHGMNVMAGDSLLRNVGGSALQGHRPGDPEGAPFLDGIRETVTRAQLTIEYEPVREFFLTGIAEFRHRKDATNPSGISQLGLRAGIRMEY